MVKNRKAIYYYLFDWANSPFSTIIITFIFSSYFVNAIAKSEIEGTALWGWTISLSALFVAILGPIIGVIADKKRNFSKYMITVFTILISVSCCLLWFSQPVTNFLVFTILIIFVSNTLFELSQIFYNSQLPYFKNNIKMGQFSGKAWAVGYLGGIFCLLIILFLFVLPEENFLNLDKNNFEHIRICGPIVGIWYLFFSIPFLYKYKKAEINYTQNNKISTLIMETLKNKNTFNFLFARMLYTDGLITLFSFGGIYASGTFNFSFNEIIYFGIALNITAAVGAYFFGFLEDKLGIKKVIIISLLCLIIVSILILLIESKLYFWFLGITLGLFIGSIQSSSRTALIKLSKKANLNRMFGFYALSGKATNFLGPLLVASFTTFFESQRAGMSSILIFLILGLLFILRARF